MGDQLKRLLSFQNVLLTLSLNLLLFTSCGYTLQHVRSLPGDVKKITIPVFDNQTMQPDIEVPFTNALQTQFYRTRYAEVVTTREEAEAFIKGTITEFRVSQVARTPVPNVQDISVVREYLVSIYVTAQLIRTSDNKVVWENQLWDTERYLANPGGQPDNTRNEDRRRVAIKSIAESVAEDIHDALTWGF